MVFRVLGRRLFRVTGPMIKFLVWFVIMYCPMTRDRPESGVRNVRIEMYLGQYVAIGSFSVMVLGRNLGRPSALCPKNLWPVMDFSDSFSGVSKGFGFRALRRLWSPYIRFACCRYAIRGS
jgi:hypothetical protein